MENILQTSQDKENLIKTLYMYKSLFEQKYLNKNLLKLWINDNWDHLEKYKISKENFMSGINELKQINLESFKEDVKV
ncbi:hypothetical protein [Campylobacter estrildidarum]|uniref:hypothetical protein n=1 Tax=Campylobacter estrildidarum TaxID=2510189 RepID=UPI001FE4AFB5|nr:hypothetical protein [Campylobacter estrildidarum]